MSSLLLQSHHFLRLREKEVLVLFGALIFIGLLIRKERTPETYYEDDDTYPKHVEDPDSDDGSHADKSG